MNRRPTLIQNQHRSPQQRRVNPYADQPPEEHEDVNTLPARLEALYPGGALENVAGISPFTEALEATSFNLGVKITGLKSFNGTTDPNDHLSYYENLMICHRYNDITKCQLFISTFKAYARTWFSGLPPR